MEGRALEEVKGCNFGFTREKGNGKGNKVKRKRRWSGTKSPVDLFSFKVDGDTERAHLGLIVYLPALHWQIIIFSLLVFRIPLWFSVIQYIDSV